MKTAGRVGEAATFGAGCFAGRSDDGCPLSALPYLCMPPTEGAHGFIYMPVGLATGAPFPLSHFYACARRKVHMALPVLSMQYDVPAGQKQSFRSVA